MGAESARGIGLRPVNSRASFGLSGACLVALAIVGCASTPPEQDPVQIMLKDSQYDRAIPAFQKFLIVYSDSSLADNAQYWLGEAYYVNKSFPEAQGAFQRVVDKYPQSRKRPDALLKIGYCQYELKQWDSAKGTLSQVVRQFPDTPAGHLAQQRLDKMASEKH